MQSAGGRTARRSRKVKRLGKWAARRSRPNLRPDIRRPDISGTPAGGEAEKRTTGGQPGEQLKSTNAQARNSARNPPDMPWQADTARQTAASHKIQTRSPTGRHPGRPEACRFTYQKNRSGLATPPLRRENIAKYHKQDSLYNTKGGLK